MNDSQTTKERLIEVATGLFAQHGYHGASIRAITSAAGANLGAVTYHFGSKEGLYRATLESLWAPILEGVAMGARGDGSALDRIEQTVRMFFVAMDQCRELAAIMSHSLPLDRPIPVPTQEAMRKLFGLLGSLIEAGQAKGEIVAGEPRLLLLSVIAQPFHVTMLRRRMGSVIGVEGESDAVYARIVDNAVAFIRRGLMKVE